MIDLVGFFIANGFNVYVLTASNILSVRYLVTKELNPKIQEKYGTTIALLPDHVIGVSTLMKDKRDGKLYKDEYLVKKNTRYRELNLKELQNYELTYELAYPLPAYEGKIEMIFKHISHDRPFFITGDSPNDHPMLEWAENRLWIARLEKNDYQEKTAKLIKESYKTKWLIQPVLYKKTPGFIASKKELVERIKVHHDEQKKLERSIAIFKQQVLLQQF